MRQLTLTIFLTITAGVFGFVEGHNWTQSVNVVDVIESGRAHVVFAKSATRQQNEARQQSEGCPVIPNSELSQPKVSERDITTRGLVF